MRLTHVLGCLVGSAVAAGASDQITVRDALGGEGAGGGTPGIYTTGTGSNLIGTLIGGPFGDPAAGQFDFEADYADGNGWVALDTFCIEPQRAVQVPLFEDDPAGLGGFRLQPLAASDMISASEADFLEVLWFNAFALSSLNDVNAAAFQILSWEAGIDDGISVAGLTNGTAAFDPADPFTASALSVATTWIDNILGGAPIWTQSTPLFVLEHPTSQDLLTPVPEPTALCMLLAGAGLFAARRR